METPDLAQAAQASAVAVAIACAIKLLTSLSMCPCPGGPTWITFSQYAANTGFSLANVSSSAPTMVLRRPSSASFGVRASGASTYLAPLFAKSSRILAVDEGSAVEVSTTMSVSRAAPRSPSSR